MFFSCPSIPETTLTAKPLTTHPLIFKLADKEAAIREGSKNQGLLCATRFMQNYGVKSYLAGAKLDHSTMVDEHGKKVFPVNTHEPTYFENDNFEGYVLLLHKPLAELQDQFDAQNLPYAKHLMTKKRRFEMRMHYKFKVEPKWPIWLGIDSQSKFDKNCDMSYKF